MAITLPYKQPRGTRAALNALRTAATLIPGLIYLVTDESYRPVVATATNTYSDLPISAELVKGISGWCAGKPTASEIIAGGKSPYAFTITAANCRASSSAAATASTVFVINKNGTQIGTINFAAAASTGTFSFTATTVAVDDRLTVVAPATPDATLSDIDTLIRN